MTWYWFERLEASEACEQNTNPIVGDPDRIEALARRLTGTALMVSEQSDRIRSVNTEQVWHGAAAAAFAERKATLPPLLDQVVRRYQAVGTALARYGPDLRQAHLDAGRALAAYQAAKAQRQAAVANAEQYAQLSAQARRQGRLFNWCGTFPASQLDAADQAVAAAIGLMAAAIDARNDAARTCSRRIDAVIQDDLRNDDSWSARLKRIGRGVAALLQRVKPVRDAAAGLAAAAILLALVPKLRRSLSSIGVDLGPVSLTFEVDRNARRSATGHAEPAGAGSADAGSADAGLADTRSADAGSADAGPRPRRTGTTRPRRRTRAPGLVGLLSDLAANQPAGASTAATGEQVRRLLAGQAATIAGATTGGARLPGGSAGSLPPAGTAAATSHQIRLRAA